MMKENSIKLGCGGYKIWSFHGSLIYDCGLVASDIGWIPTFWSFLTMEAVCFSQTGIHQLDHMVSHPRRRKYGDSVVLYSFSIHLVLFTEPSSGCIIQWVCFILYLRNLVTIIHVSFPVLTGVGIYFVLCRGSDKCYYSYLMTVQGYMKITPYRIILSSQRTSSHKMGLAFPIFTKFPYCETPEFDLNAQSLWHQMNYLTTDHQDSSEF
jgi:hypothetical protein